MRDFDSLIKIRNAVVVDFNDKEVRYLDDIAELVVDLPWFLKVPRGPFASIRFQNLRLNEKEVKPSKTIVNFLGTKIHKKRIEPSPQTISRGPHKETTFAI